MTHVVTLTNQFSRDRAKICAHCGVTFERDSRCTWKYWLTRAKYCSAKCGGAAHSAEAKAKRLPMRESFERWFVRSDGCWEWQGACDRDGYGAFNYAGKTRRAPVVALEIDGRKPAQGEYACHRCDNPKCVRPDHLYPGTPTQNMADAIARGTTQRGERQHMAKLTEQAVREIRSSAEAVSILAKRFGVTHGAVSMARARKTWRHVA